MTVHRPGFTLVELLIVVLVIGIMVRIAMPSYQELVYKARAAQAFGDINLIRMAAYEYNADTNQWPADYFPGVVPPELEPYLSADISFNAEHYSIDWENWILPDGTPKHPGTGVLLGVSITTDDQFLGAALEELLGDRAHYTLGQNYTFVIAGI